MTARGYMVGHIEVLDPGRFAEYLEADAPVLARYGGRFVIRGGRADVNEPDLPPRHVVIEFDDYATALAYYRSDEYQAARRIRESCTRGGFVMVEGVDEESKT